MMREIRIRPVLNGFIATVGCQELAYTDTDKLLVDLGHYLRDPEATEKRLIEQEGFNRKHTLLNIRTERQVPNLDSTECEGRAGQALIAGGTTPTS